MDIRRYDIVQADLGKAVGSEQAGIRPVLIAQNDQGNKFSNTTIIIPLKFGEVLDKVTGKQK